MIRRFAIHTAIGFTAGALITVGAGIGCALADWQRAARTARRTAQAYGRATR